MGNSFGDFLAGPTVQSIAALLSSIRQRRLTQDYTADQDRQIADALGVASRIGPETLATYDDGSQDALRALIGIQSGSKKDVKALTDQIMAQMDSRSKAVMGDYNAGTKAYGQGLDSFLGGQEAETAGLDSEYQDRYNTAAKDLEGYGNQMKADVDEGFKNKEAAVLQNLSNRGWGNSTATGSASIGVERERSAEQRRLGDDLVRQRVGILSGLSGDRLSAKERRKAQTGQYRFGGLGQMLNNNLGRANLRGGLMGDRINALQSLGTWGIQNDQANRGNVANFYGNNANNRANLVGSGLGSYLNTIMGINLVPPPPNQLPFMFGQNSVDPPSAPSFLESFLPGAVQGGLSAGGMIAGASIIATAAVCIDGESLLETPDGPLPLSDVKVGMVVLNSSGDWKKVIAKHHRTYTGDDSLYVRLSFGDRSIVASLDHPIEGKPVSEWIANGVSCERATPETAGDILLEDESAYLANGYAVTSLIDKSCIALLNEVEPENQLVSA